MTNPMRSSINEYSTGIRKAKDNELLNASSQAVKDDLSERLWALMYLQHLATRVNQTDTCQIYQLLRVYQYTTPEAVLRSVLHYH